MAQSPAPLDLARHRALGELLSTSLALFRDHAAVFLTVALLFTAPITLAVDGIWGRALAEGADARPPSEVRATSLILQLVVIPLVTAIQVVIVQGLARGRPPGVRAALGAAAPRLPAVIVAVLLYVVAVAGGLLALVVPGVWLIVRWYFVAQAVVIDRLSPVEALRRSGELVRGRWWRTAGCLLAAGLLFGFAGTLVTAILAGIDNGAIYVAGVVIVQSIVLSLTTIFATLLFFDLRARREIPWQGTEPVDPDAPERPGS
jgi:hypothetical protein